MSQIQTISKTLKPSNGVVVASNMNTPIDAQNPDCLYFMNISIGTAFDIRLALLTGDVLQNHISKRIFV